MTLWCGSCGMSPLVWQIGMRRRGHSVAEVPPVWSPSHTERWLLCPVKEQLTRDGVIGRLEKWSPGAIVGTALHKGLAILMQDEEQEPKAIVAVQESVNAEWPPDGTAGWDVNKVIAETITCLRRIYRERMPELLQDNGCVVGVECALGEGDTADGRYPGTPDLITEHGPEDGRYLCVTDWKSHWVLDDRYIERELVSTEESWQLFQYAWFAQQYYALPVRHVRKCVIRVINPKSWLYTVKVTPERLTRWHAQATVVWEQMSHSTPWQNWGSCRRYGRCEFWEHCHV